MPGEPAAWRPTLVSLRNIMVAAAMVWVCAFSVKLMEHRPAAEIRLRPLALITGMFIGAAVVSGLLHALHHGATWMSEVATGLEAGTLPALAHAPTQNSWNQAGIRLRPA